MKKSKIQRIVDNRLKPPKDFFEWCYSQIDTFKWSNNKQTILASDRKNCNVVEKRLTKATNLDFFHKFYAFVITLVTHKRIETQQYGFTSRIIAGKQYIDVKLTNMVRISGGKIDEIGLWGDRYLSGLVPMYSNLGGPWTDSKYYYNDWREKLRTISELKYIEYPNPDLHDLKRVYKYREEIEFLQKIGANRLADEILYPRYKWTSSGSWVKTVDMRTVNKSWLRKNKAKLKAENPTFIQCELEVQFAKYNAKVVPGIESLLTVHDIKRIPVKTKLERFQKWIIKNNVNFKYYMDYINMLKELGIEPDSENLYMPTDFKKAHDNAVNLLNQHKKDVENKKFEKRYVSIKKIECEIDGFIFLAPKKANDLINEGKKLSHCVGSAKYIEEHANGVTTIMFMRDIQKRDKPLYTLEIKNKKIIQIRGKHNMEPEGKAKEIAEKWVQAL